MTYKEITASIIKMDFEVREAWERFMEHIEERDELLGPIIAHSQLQ